MKTTEADYPSRAVEATRRVLLELARVLGEYGDHVVLVGGWVPELLAPGAGHVGSTDVDLALDHVALSDTGYARLRDLLDGAGYRNDPDPARQFVFYRDVRLGDGGTPNPVVVELDLLAAEYGGTGKNRRSQAVQGTRPRKARGADLAFERDLSVEVPLDGALPDGRLARAHLRVAGPVPFLVTKAAALALRDKVPRVATRGRSAGSDLTVSHMRHVSVLALAVVGPVPAEVIQAGQAPLSVLAGRVHVAGQILNNNIFLKY